MDGHQPVLLKEVLDLFAPGEGLYLDGTFGGGGHSQAILEKFPAASLIGLDRDPEAQARADQLRERFGDRFSFFDLRFSQLDKIIALPRSAGVLLDLGVSSFQLDTITRGFSFRHDAPADMRLDPRSGRSAAEWLESAEREEIERALRDFGEEPRWRKISAAILAARGTGQLQRTGSLAELIAAHAAAPRKGPGKKIHPATQAFQGIRMAVNDELGELERALPKALEALAPGGVLAVISFHSLEDRLVKRAFNRFCGRPEHAGDARTADQREQLAERVTRKPVLPGDAELAENRRSRSAKLRAIRKL